MGNKKKKELDDKVQLKLKKGEIIETFTRESDFIYNIRFDKYFESEKFKILNKFVMKPKLAYRNNWILIFPYINIFMDEYDDDGELLLSYFQIKAILGKKHKYSKELFKQDLYDRILSDSMVEKIRQYVDDYYDINLSINSKRNKYDAIEFTNLHGKMLLCISIAIKLMIPLVNHYLHITNCNKKDKMLYYIFKDINVYFEKGTDINMYNKLMELINSKMMKSATTDKVIWEKLKILGIDIMESIEDIYKKLYVDIMYKFTFNDHMVSLINTVIKNNRDWIPRNDFEFNLNGLSQEAKDEDGLSDMDKLEVAKAKMDESFVLMSRININQVIKKLCKQHGVKIKEDELNYYLNNINPNKFQKEIICSFFADDFGGFYDTYAIGLEDYCKLIIIFNRVMSDLGFRYIQFLLSGVMRKGGKVKKLQKKKLQKIIQCSDYEEIQKQSTFSSNTCADIVLDDITKILNSKFYLVSYELLDRTGKYIDISRDERSIIQEYLKFVTLI